ncbi:MAG TPA: D-aminoacylase [Candidatus Sulfotelmatobacter sp.]|nr:D-aminoacylase [Candidatus Sulfotelmatobacter sp.]
MRTARALLAQVILIVLATVLFAQNETAYDLVIVNAHIVDGSGSPWYEGSIAIRNGKVAAVGRLVDVSAKRTIDAKHMIVAPGFIDLHSHSDFTLLADGKAESKIRQGVTTEILGESESAGPVLGPAEDRADKELATMGLKRNWKTLGEYFSVLQKHGTAVNIASYVGAGQVRYDVMGNVNRRPTPAEMDQMKALVNQAMQDGAIGLSAGLIYPPDSFAKTEDFVELAKVAARYGGIYTSHIRDEGDHEPEALREAIEIGEKAGLPTHILHLKMAGAENWGKIGAMTAIIQAARDRGLDVTADQYPYIAGMTGLQMCLPPKYLEGTHQQVIDRLKDPRARGEVRNMIQNGVSGWENHVQGTGGWHGVMVASVQNAQNKQFEGKRMDEVAKSLGKDPVDALAEILISEETFPFAIYFAMNEKDVRTAMREPWVGIGSDGVAVNPEMKFMGRPHPRFYGTFPRVLSEYVREQKVIPLEDAIRKMTSLPAQITGLSDRGLLRMGLAADIVIFDPDKVRDTATFEDPSHYPEGIPYVIVNGSVVIDEGQHSGALPGQILYGRGKTTK